jgi:squalene-hopene/tetraprenyl-beta-curcumene cyclase
LSLQESALSILGLAVERSAAALAGLQRPDGHWVFPLEADATIPAEYVLLQHYLGEPDKPLEQRIAVYLRAVQGAHGGWPLFHGGDFDMSASVKAYFALKAIGDDPQASHMVRARIAILHHGGAARSNVFTRILLALFGQVPWRAVPVMPVEITLLPGWFPMHLDKVSYWSRTVLVPLLVLMAARPRARNPLGVQIKELFVTPAELVKNWYPGPPPSTWGWLFRGLDHVLHAVEPLFPKALRRRAVARAVEFVDARLNGEHGLGAIFPAMANAVMMYDLLGVTDGRLEIAKDALRRLIVEEEDRAWVQPCMSPVWDTALACHALAEAGYEAPLAAAGEWLAERQILHTVGDWAVQRPGLRPGGWAFQYANDFYPDTDDTAVVVSALARIDGARHGIAIEHGLDWLRGMQSANGGWGAFDAENTHYALNHIPFADHGALLDPPTADVSARCVMALAAVEESEVVRRGLDYLLAEQEADGSWFGRWGTNYIYGTWSALIALEAAGVSPQSAAVRRAVGWLLDHQRGDGGWGEDGRSYWPGQPHGEGPVSTPSQTAWALLGLMAAGQAHHPAVGAGIRWLLEHRNAAGLWDEQHFTAVGFPRVFYLRYHGYAAIFPVWALARYHRLSGLR